MLHIIRLIGEFVTAFSKIFVIPGMPIKIRRARITGPCIRIEKSIRDDDYRATTNLSDSTWLPAMTFTK